MILKQTSWIALIALYCTLMPLASSGQSYYRNEGLEQRDRYPRYDYSRGRHRDRDDYYRERYRRDYPAYAPRYINKRHCRRESFLEELFERRHRRHHRW